MLVIAAAAALVAGCSVQTSASSATRTISGVRAHTRRASTRHARAHHRTRGHPLAVRRPTTAPKLTLFTEPAAGVGPILTAINHGRTSVELVMYELEEAKVENALVAAERRGVHVRVLLNHGYYGESTDYGRPAFNLPAYRYLVNHGVPVRWTPSHFALTHEKALIVDQRTAYIMTFNLTSQYYASSRDFGAVDRSAADVSAISATFDADWSDQTISPSNGADLVWSPGAESEQIEFIDHAHTSLDVENEEMDQTGIEAALEGAVRRGVRVRVVMTYSSDWAHAFAALRAAGVQVRTYSKDAPLYIHAKLMVTPSEAFLGSQNFSSTSLQANRELGLTLSAPGILRSLSRTFDSDFAGGRPH